jgi:predicted deacylase
MGARSRFRDNVPPMPTIPALPRLAPQILAILLAAASPAAAAGLMGPPRPWGELQYLDAVVQPGESRQASWGVSESFAGVVAATPILIVRGTEPGPTLCVTAGIHGDELNGIEIVRRLLESVDAEALHGTVIGVPIVNLHGFRRSSRYLPDRRDLNRYFPGRQRGSSASRIADAFFRDVVLGCEMLVDMHTGSFHRTNLPHVRANLSEPDVFEMALGFSNTTIVHSLGTPGTLRRAATEAGIPAITFEAGEPMRFQIDDVKRGVDGIRNLMRSQGMLKKRWLGGEPQIYRRSHWVRCNDGGILISEVELGDRVETGQLLGTVTDPLTNERALLLAPHDGTVIGMAVNQVVMPGFAAFHLGVHAGASLPEGDPEPGDEEDWAIESVEENLSDADERPEE